MFAEFQQEAEAAERETITVKKSDKPCIVENLFGGDSFSQ